MHTIARTPLLILAAICLCFIAACSQRNLRGTMTKSADGKSYLAVIDDNGGKCGPLLVDGKPWPYKIGTAGPIAPGHHVIECGTQQGFEVPQGVIYGFDYWGP